MVSEIGTAKFEFRTTVGVHMKCGFKISHYFLLFNIFYFSTTSTLTSLSLFFILFPLKMFMFTFLFFSDPMAKVFPKVTKCSFHKYGPSGTIEIRDGLCVLPLNIINEKIYILLWFWSVIGIEKYLTF